MDKFASIDSEVMKFFSDTKGFSEDSREIIAKSKTKKLAEDYKRESNPEKKRLLKRRVIRWGRIAGYTAAAIAALLGTAVVYGAGQVKGITDQYTRDRDVVNKHINKSYENVMNSPWYKQDKAIENSIRHKEAGSIGLDMDDAYNRSSIEIYSDINSFIGQLRTFAEKVTKDKSDSEVIKLRNQLKNEKNEAKRKEIMNKIIEWTRLPQNIAKGFNNGKLV